MYSRIVVTFATIIIIGLAFAADDSPDAPWTGLWFPKNPESKPAEAFPTLNGREQSTFREDEDTLQMAESKFSEKSENWKGLWFPAPPGQSVPQTSETIVSKEDVKDNQSTKMGKTDAICDDGMTNLNFDYDPRNISHHDRHLCLYERKHYTPSYDVSPRLLDYTIPPEYVALHKCMDEEIEYDDEIPTL